MWLYTRLGNSLSIQKYHLLYEASTTPKSGTPLGESMENKLNCSITSFFLTFNPSTMKEYCHGQSILSNNFSNMLCLHNSFCNSAQCLCCLDLQKESI